MRFDHFIACAGSIAVASLAVAGGATFETIPGAVSADDMTPDGRFVVGTYQGFQEGEEWLYQTYRLDRQTGTLLILPQPATNAVAVSDDGSVILGSIPDPATGHEIAAIWTLASNQWTSIGSLPTGLACPSLSSAYELSSDGSVAVGLGWVDGCHGTGFRWTEATGMVPLEILGNGANRASVVNANATIIGGFAQGSGNRTPAVWFADNSGELLDPPNGDATGEIYGMNDAGTVLLGSWNGKATKWSGGLSVQTTIGDGSILPGWTGIPLDIANNGTTVGFDILFTSRRAWIQVGGNGPLIELRSYLLANGAQIPSTITLEVPQAISADGTTIIGHGLMSGPWIATIETPALCAADLDPASGGDGMVDGADLGSLLGEWGACPGCRSDFNGDGAVDGDDLGTLLGQWGPCAAVPGACCFGEGCAQLTAEECAAAGGSFEGASVPCSPTICVHNDSCADAVDITDRINGDWILADNSTATPGFGGGDPEIPENSPSCHWSGEWWATHSTIWYRFVAPPMGIITLNLCDQFEGYTTMNDSVVAIYSGECGSLVEFACNDDGCPDGFYSHMQFLFGLEPGQTYYLMIGNPGGWTGSIPGTFRFSLTSP